ncbi:hypothetical protein POVCU2_0019680 [Plasmodium ovale curtisi]|uniref:Uncharacterized protein n=1 Tax=Plasmodium ovale curtisi TaxID=864141 RepID=A0A1A8WAT9_PLAOA|nr:hypothetical protein POVCU2_0019680 [Plasmodium ovale curtisi]SBS90131.1 hypothetical protein POVCU1_017650 [Plasmodium ovale curtisi]
MGLKKQKKKAGDFENKLQRISKMDHMCGGKTIGASATVANVHVFFVVGKAVDFPILKGVVLRGKMVSKNGNVDHVVEIAEMGKRTTAKIKSTDKAKGTEKQKEKNNGIFQSACERR